VTDRMLVIPRKKRRMRCPAENMKTPYGLEVIESHLTDTLPKGRSFLSLPPAVRGNSVPCALLPLIAKARFSSPKVRLPVAFSLFIKVG
jgi:hypothetical protein